MICKEIAEFYLQLENNKQEKYLIYALILPGNHYKITLGMDYLSKNKFKLDMESNSINIFDREFNIHISETKTDVCNNKSIQTAEAKKIKEMVDYYAKVLPKLGNIKEYEHEIELEQEKRIESKPYRVPIKLRTILYKEVQRLLKENIIRKSNSNICSPAFLIPKKNEEYRLVTDYRRLNAITKKDKYPLPQIRGILEELQGSKYFSQVDLNSGYHQIDIKEVDKYKTSFVLPFGQYEYNKLPFGLTNAPRTFQRTLNTILADLPFVKIYLDDILIHSETLREHVKHLETVFKRFKHYNVSINWNKSKFNIPKVKYLGCVIDENGIHPSTEIINRFKFKVPTTKKELQRILGFINYFRPFIQNISLKLVNIYDKLKKESKFTWNETDTKILSDIEKELREETVLHHPDINRRFVIKTDASNLGMGAILEQDNRIIRYYSYKWKDSEKNYTIVEKEMFAIVRALRDFHNIIYGSILEIFTDNKNITFIKNFDNTRMERWKIEMEKYTYTLKHVSAEHNKETDFLSRNFSIKTNNLAESNKLFEDINKSKIFNEDLTRRFLTAFHKDIGHPGTNKTYYTLKDILKIKKIYYRKRTKLQFV